MPRKSQGKRYIEEQDEHGSVDGGQLGKRVRSLPYSNRSFERAQSFEQRSSSFDEAAALQSYSSGRDYHTGHFRSSRREGKKDSKENLKLSKREHQHRQQKNAA